MSHITSKSTNRSQLPPRLSIGLPVYNGQGYLREALDSFLAQTYTDFEIIISDNCSTDLTAEICQEYARKDRRIRYQRTQQNQGAVDNFNRVVSFARGEFFKWAAHDDLCAPTYLERCIATLEHDPSVVLCHSDTELIDHHSQPLPLPSQGVNYVFDQEGRIVYLGKDSPSRKLDSYRAHERFESVILQTDWVFEIFGVFRLDALKKIGLLEQFYGGDKLLLAKITTMGRVVIIPEKLFLNRRHAEQSMSLTTIEGQEAWIDPHTKKAGSLHRLRRLRGFAAAAFGGRMSLSERVGCLLVVMRYYGRFERWHHMLDEITGTRQRRIARESGTQGTSS